MTDPVLKVGLELNGNRKLTYSKDLMKNSATVQTLYFSWANCVQRNVKNLYYNYVIRAE